MPDPQTPRWRRYLRFWRSNVRADVDDEFSFHVQERIDDLIALGLHPTAARDEAMRAFGNIDQLKDTCRTLAEEQETHMKMSETFGVVRQDVSFALRSMRSNMSFTTAIVLTLAVGIGATTAIFSLVNAVILRPLPYADQDRMVMIMERFGEGRGSASVGHYTSWSEQNRTLEATSAYQAMGFILADNDPTRIVGARVTPSFFKTGYMPPALGRYMLPDEAQARVVVLSYPLWQTRYAADPAVVGKQISLNGEMHTVIGVTPEAYTLTPQDEKLWTPLSFTPEQRSNYGAHAWTVFAKLKPGVTVAQAQADMARITEDIRRREPENMKQRGVEVVSFRDILIGDYRTQLWVLLGAVTFVLLIGCANVANLLLARATSRRKEIAIRGALGGARNRLVRQLLTESLVLAFVGGLAGLLVAKVMLRFLVGMGPEYVPRLREAGLQPDVLGFALLATAVCGILFGLAPAIRATRVNLQSELRQGGRGSSGLIRDRARGLLVVTEIAVAVVLLVSAGLFIRSAQRLQNIPPGFQPNGVTMTRVALPAARYQEPKQVESAFQRIVDQVRAIPGVKTAAAGTRVPMWGRSIDMGIRVDDKPRDPNKVQIGHVRMVTDGYTETLGIPILRGRSLQSSDLMPGAKWVIVVNETFAKTVFGTQDPIGHRIMGWSSDSAPQWREIVGMMGDVRAFGRENDIPPEIYMPMTQAPDGAWNSFNRGMTVIAKSQPGVALGPSLRKAVNTVDATLPLFDVQTMESVLEQSTAVRRFNTMLLTLLGLTGLLLAAIGIYGVIAFFVTQRTHEIGVRVALGASSQSVMRMVVGQAFMMAIIGVTVGGVAAFWATKVLSTMLFQVNARDPVAFTTAAAVLIGVALAAALIPARRATRVDPVRALASAG